MLSVERNSRLKKSPTLRQLGSIINPNPCVNVVMKIEGRKTTMTTKILATINGPELLLFFCVGVFLTVWLIWRGKS